MNNNIEQLIADLKCDDIIKCQKARRSLVLMGHEAVAPLEEALGHGSHWVRWEASKALGQIGDEHATKVLVKALQDPEFDVRWLSAEALIKIGEKSIEPLLVALTKFGAKSEDLRQGAHHVLHDVKTKKYAAIIKPVMIAVDDGRPHVEVPIVAKQALDALRSGR